MLESYSHILRILPLDERSIAYSLYTFSVFAVLLVRHVLQELTAGGDSAVSQGVEQLLTVATVVAAAVVLSCAALLLLGSLALLALLLLVLTLVQVYYINMILFSSAGIERDSKII
jgi:hypothetical protein